MSKSRVSWGTHRDTDVNQKVRANKAITDLCRLIVDDFLRQIDSTIDEKWLAEVECREQDSRWNCLEHSPLQYAI